MTRLLSTILSLCFMTSLALATDLSLTPSRWRGTPALPPISSPWTIAVPKVPKEVAYVYTPTRIPVTATKLVIDYEVIGTGTLVSIGETGSPNITLYFQKAGDDWQCTKTGPVSSQTQYSRWWSAIRPDVTPGVHTLETILQPENWISCYGAKGNSSNDAMMAFKAARDAASNVGFGFGSTSASHGMSVSSGSVTFKMKRYAIQ